MMTCVIVVATFLLASNNPRAVSVHGNVDTPSATEIRIGSQSDRSGKLAIAIEREAKVAGLKPAAYSTRAVAPQNQRKCRCTLWGAAIGAAAGAALGAVASSSASYLHYATTGEGSSVAPGMLLGGTAGAGVGALIGWAISR